MLDEFSQAGTDGVEKLVEIQVRDDGIVNFQQKAHAVPFMRQLLLSGLRLLEVKGVIDSHRHLSCNLLEKAKLSGLIRFFMNAPHGDSSQASMRGAQRQTATRPDVICAQPLHRSGKASFMLNVIKTQRLLGLPNRTRQRFVDGQFRNQVPGPRLFQNVYAHYISLRIMEPNAEVVEVKNIAQRISEIVEQLREVSMRNDRLGHP